MKTIPSIRLQRFAKRNYLLLLTLICIGSFVLAQVALGVTHAAAAAADLTITKTGDESVPRGSNITYSLVVINGGPDDAFNVTITDPLPANTTFVSATNNSGGTATFANNTLTVTFSTIVAGDAASATFVVNVNPDTPRGTTISNTATVTSDTPDPESSNNSSTALTAVTGTFAGDIIISEFRLRGPNGANDEFIEIYNNTGSDHLVASVDASAGYGIAASDGNLRCTIPNGILIPNGGHYLCVNSVGYSLASYPAGNGTTATGDATYTTDIPDNVGITLFSTSNPSNFTLANRLDSVGSNAELSPLYREGTGYPALTPISSNHSFYRDTCGKGGSITATGGCPKLGFPKDTDNNAADFVFVDTNGTSAGAGQRLGAPGPENLSSPIQRNASISVALLDASKASSSPPNRVRDFTSDPANNSTFGTLDIRRRFINNTGDNVSRLRFRVIDITTFPAPSGIADLRPRTSTAVVVSNIGDTGTCDAEALTTPCTVTVQGTTLEQPPSQPNGGGFNSSLSADTVTLAAPLAPGASINVRFLLGIQQTGSFRFFINIEALNGSSVQQFRPLRSPTKRVRAVSSTRPR